MHTYMHTGLSRGTASVHAAQQNHINIHIHIHTYIRAYIHAYRVDHDSVEGQPLSTLRSRILGKQGSYVTLGFRRKEGPETTVCMYVRMCVCVRCVCVCAYVCVGNRFRM